jgi:hypothetical protein
VQVLLALRESMKSVISSRKVTAGTGSQWPSTEPAEGVDAVGWREAAGGRRGITFWVKRRSGLERTHPDQHPSDRQQDAHREGCNYAFRRLARRAIPRGSLRGHGTFGRGLVDRASQNLS